jgi:hypothetical protein
MAKRAIEPPLPSDEPGDESEANLFPKSLVHETNIDAITRKYTIFIMKNFKCLMINDL